MASCNQWQSQSRYQTSVQVLFEPGEPAIKHYARIRSWRKQDFSTSSASANHSKPAIEYVPSSGGSQSLQIEVEAASFDSVLLNWISTPLTQGSFCIIPIRFNTFAGDFSASEGVAGKRMIISTKTRRLLGSDAERLSSGSSEESWLHVNLVFNSGVAQKTLLYVISQARREEGELRGLPECGIGHKGMDWTFLEAQLKDHGYKNYLSPPLTATDQTKTIERCGKDQFAEDKSYKVRPLSLFRHALRPHNQCAAFDQPDVERHTTVFKPGHPKQALQQSPLVRMEDVIVHSVGSDVLSDPCSLSPIASTENFFLPEHSHYAGQNRMTAKLGSSENMRAENINFEVSCAGCGSPVTSFHIRSENLGSAQHYAIHLKERTIEALIKAICVRFRAQPEMVQQITYFDQDQVQVLVDRNNVARLPDGLYMIVRLGFARQPVSYSSLQRGIADNPLSPTDSGSTSSDPVPFMGVGLASMSNAEYFPRL